jgi:outer membrane protein assembly factor BamB
MQRSIAAGPAIGLDGTVYVGGLYDPNLYAVNSGDGSLKWVCNLAHVVYTKFTNGTEPLDPNENSFWERGWLAHSPVVGPDRMIYAGAMYDTFLHAIDPNTGTILWSKDILEYGNYGSLMESDPYVERRPNPAWYGADYLDDYSNCSIFSTPAIGEDGTLYVSFDDPFLRAVDPNGEIQWVTRLGVTGGFTMAVGADGLIYAASDDGSVYVVNADGREAARFDGESWLEFPALGGEGTLYVSDANHVLWAIDPWTTGMPGLADLHRPQDLDQDGGINGSDLAGVVAEWLECREPYSDDCLDETGEYYYGLSEYLSGDVDRNLYVDLRDVAKLGERWLGK